MTGSNVERVLPDGLWKCLTRKRLSAVEEILRDLKDQKEKLEKKLSNIMTYLQGYLNQDFMLIPTKSEEGDKQMRIGQIISLQLMNAKKVTQQYDLPLQQEKQLNFGGDIFGK